MAACLRHIHARTEKPNFILNTGDCVMDSLRTDLPRTRVQWDLWKRILKDECALPIRHGIGNHDIWGWKKESQTTGTEPLWGKAMGLEMLELERAYYSFDHGAWHFIMLDSIFPIAPDSWHARLDDEQFEWLESDLKSADPARPVLVASHCPLFSPSAIIRTGAENPAVPGQLTSTGTATHLDIARLGQLFNQHPNVKLCISGHLHQSDRAEYRGVTYISNPAVSANKWKGRSAGRWEEMYTLLELHPDGQFNVDYVDFDWTAQPRG
jgi:3',5'-cyclic AMP phosphodiesterase CpdA